MDYIDDIEQLEVLETERIIINMAKIVRQKQDLEYENYKLKKQVEEYQKRFNEIFENNLKSTADFFNGLADKLGGD